MGAGKQQIEIIHELHTAHVCSVLDVSTQHFIDDTQKRTFVQLLCNFFANWNTTTPTIVISWMFCDWNTFISPSSGIENGLFSNEVNALIRKKM